MLAVFTPKLDCEGVDCLLQLIRTEKPTLPTCDWFTTIGGEVTEGFTKESSSILGEGEGVLLITCRDMSAGERGLSSLAPCFGIPCGEMPRALTL